MEPIAHAAPGQGTCGLFGRPPRRWAGLLRGKNWVARPAGRSPLLKLAIDADPGPAPAPSLDALAPVGAEAPGPCPGWVGVDGSPVDRRRWELTAPGMPSEKLGPAPEARRPSSHRGGGSTPPSAEGWRAAAVVASLAAWRVFGRVCQRARPAGTGNGGHRRGSMGGQRASWCAGRSAARCRPRPRHRLVGKPPRASGWRTQFARRHGVALPRLDAEGPPRRKWLCGWRPPRWPSPSRRPSSSWRRAPVPCRSG